MDLTLLPVQLRAIARALEDAGLTEVEPVSLEGVCAEIGIDPVADLPEQTWSTLYQWIRDRLMQLDGYDEVRDRADRLFARYTKAARDLDRIKHDNTALQDQLQEQHKALEASRAARVSPEVVTESSDVGMMDGGRVTQTYTRLAGIRSARGSQVVLHCETGPAITYDPPHWPPDYYLWGNPVSKEEWERYMRDGGTVPNTLYD